MNPDQASFESLKKAFVSRYIRNESELEGVNYEQIHGKAEIKGLQTMYEYIHSDEIDHMFNVYTLKELHEKLYSATPYPEFGGTFRNDTRFLPGTGTEITDWTMIRYELNNLDPEVLELYDLAKEINGSGEADLLLEYLDRCVVLGCKLVKIHPFGDGNGRTIRGFINKLLEEAGLPPIYIKTQERTEYHKAMNAANNEDDYSLIKNFYRYKVCDSIIELDINERIRMQLDGKENVSKDVVVKEKIQDLNRPKVEE